MSFGLSLSQLYHRQLPRNLQRRPQLQGSGPWANLGAPLWTPSLLCGGLGQKSFLFGASPETGYLWYRGRGSGNFQAYQLFKMLPILTSSGGGGAVTLLQYTNSSSDGNRHNDECSTQLASTQDASEDLPLDFSSSGQFGGQEVAVAIETQEVRRTSSSQTCEASVPSPSSEGVHPMDLSSQKRDSMSSEEVGDGEPSSDPDPKAAMEVEDLKAEIGKLQEKLERSQDDFNKRVLQLEKYSREETTALLKAICWKGQLHMEYDDLPIRHIPLRMKCMLYWDENFRGQGSLLGKFRENLSEKRDRDCVSVKRKWNRILKAIAKIPHEFFQKHAHVHKIDDDEKVFLIKQAKVCCVFKGIDPSKQQPAASAAPLSHPTAPSSDMAPPPPTLSSSSGNPFLDDHDDIPNGWRDMPVFTASQFSRSRFN